MAYGARLESVLGASPRGFESPILRHRTPGPVEVPGFLYSRMCMWVCAWEYVRGLVHARVGLELCARGGAVRAGLELCARTPLLAALTH